MVTGAGTGIGKEVSRKLARRGALVYVTALAKEEAQLMVDTVLTN